MSGSKYLVLLDEAEDINEAIQFAFIDQAEEYAIGYSVNRARIYKTMLISDGQTEINLLAVLGD